MSKFEVNKYLVFYYCSLFGLIAPILAVFIPHLFMKEQPTGLLFAALICFTGTIFNFYLYIKKKRLKVSAQILNLIFILSFSIGVFSSGGLNSSIVIYGPTLILIAGLLNGVGGVILPSFSFIFFIALIYFLEKLKIHSFILDHVSNSQLALELITSIGFSGLLTGVFVYLKDKSENQLKNSNNLLNEEKNKTKEKEILLTETQKISKLGNWSFHLQTGTIIWSETLFSLFPVKSKLQPPDFQSFVEMIHVEDREHFLKKVDNCINNGVPYQIIHRVIFPEKIIWIEGHGDAKKDANGNIIELFGTAQDVTEKIEIENILKQSIAQNNAIINSAKFSIITTNLDGIITTFNKEAEMILGYKENEMVGINSPAIFHELSEIIAVTEEICSTTGLKFQPGFETFVRSIDYDLFRERQWTYIKKNGEKFPVLLSLTALYDFNNNICGYMGIAKNISEEVKNKSIIDQQRNELLRSAKLASLGELSAGIAHEINNPLSIISGSTELLKKFKDQPEKFDKKIENINRCVDRISKIINGLKKFSRTEKTQEFKIQSLNKIIEESITLTSIKANNSGIEIFRELTCEAEIYCDEIEIEQVLVNLISNAIDAIEMLNEKWIKIKLSHENDTFILKIIDSGFGIPKDIQQKIFNPFFTTKEIGKGTGLGLSISKGILDAHGASINIINYDQYTCFEIKFQNASEIKNVAS